jgi:hypothetical protein
MGYKGSMDVSSVVYCNDCPNRSQGYWRVSGV